MGVNSLPKTVGQQHLDCDLNPGPSVPESSTLTSRLPIRPQIMGKTLKDAVTMVRRIPPSTTGRFVGPAC